MCRGCNLLITVVIPHLNQPAGLEKCLDSLHRQEGSEASVEIIVVDNGSKTLPSQICSRWPDVRLLSETTPGPGPARNRGIENAKAEIVAFIDADCTAAPGWIAAIETAFSDPATLVIGGDVRVPYAEGRPPTALEAYERIYAYRNREYVASGYSGTGNLAMRRRVFETVGPFGGIEIAEDKDWGLRARALGIDTKYVADMVIYHPARATFEDMKKKWDRHIAHDYALVSTVGDRLKWVVRALAIGASPIGEVWKVVTSDRVHGAGERLKAFLCLVRVRGYRCRKMLAVLGAGDAGQLSGAWNRK